VLENMMHRGAEGSDGKTGDGAGILIQSRTNSFYCRASPYPKKASMVRVASLCLRTKALNAKSSAFSSRRLSARVST
jgi:glutamate synthase domain-containing protein 1